MKTKRKTNFQKLITLSSEMAEDIRQFQLNHHFPSGNAAIRCLLGKALEEEGIDRVLPTTVEEGIDKVKREEQPRRIEDVVLPEDEQSLQAIKRVIDFLAKHGSTHFQSIEIGARGRRELNKNMRPLAGYKEIQQDEHDRQYYATYYFLPKAWRDVLHGFHLEKITKDCATAGLIMRPKTGQGFQIRKDIPGVDKKRVYAISANYAHLVYDALHKARIM